MTEELRLSRKKDQDMRTLNQGGTLRIIIF